MSLTDWSLISAHKSMERISPQEERSGARKEGEVSRDLVSGLIARLLKNFLLLPLLRGVLKVTSVSEDCSWGLWGEGEST